MAVQAARRTSVRLCTARLVIFLQVLCRAAKAAALEPRADPFIVPLIAATALNNIGFD